MQLKRAIISFSLLLVYALGFSHDLIPHCHDDGIAHKHEHGHEHHYHDDHEHSHTTDHEHILHQGHFDEDLIDLLICVLTESEHPSSDDEHCFYLPEVRNYKANDQNFKFLTSAMVLVLFRDREDDQAILPFEPEQAGSYLPPPITASPHRGPPVVS